MLRFVAAAIACLMLSGLGGGSALAKQCRDAQGKFTKCASPKPMAPKRCRDAAGKFIKCSSAKTM